MAAGDEVLFYHSGEEKSVVGLARVVRGAYPDPTAEEPGWVAVDLAPVRPLPRAITLAAVKADPGLKQLGLVRQSRLSVMPVADGEWDLLLAMAGL
jgi:predicted RNA-binding protein with PUA-like domain